jgi:DNA-binding response OmpR family regulator
MPPHPDRTAGNPARFAEHLVKPFALTELSTRIRMLLQYARHTGRIGCATCLVESARTHQQAIAKGSLNAARFETLITFAKRREHHERTRASDPMN